MSDPSIHQLLAATAPADSDPQESAEWRDAFRAVLQAAGPARARELMAIATERDQVFHALLRALRSKAQEIDTTIKRLQALSNGLHHAAVCPAENHFECPTFKRLLLAAGKGRLGGRGSNLGGRC